MSENMQDMEVEEGCVLPSGSTLYQVNQFIGSGSFGRVAKAVDLLTGRAVALKTLEAKKSSAARREIEMLLTVQVLDPIKTNLVQCFEMFEYAGLTCLAFEMLDQSLLRFMEDREWEPLSLSEIRPIAQQLLTALDALKTIGVIHADLKIDNVMLVNHQNQPFRVKLIDFGLSGRTSEVRDGMVIQIDACRAPEVFLGLPPSEAVDTWSLGCLLATLFTSSHLFGNSSRYEVVKNIVEVVGQPPDHLLRAGVYTKEYFKEDQYLDSPKWWLKTPFEYYQDSGFRPTLHPRPVNSLFELMVVIPEMGECIQITDHRAFVSLLMGLLNTDPQRRASPGEALRHPFISMVHLEDQVDSDYVIDSVQKMTAFINKESREDEPTVGTSDLSPEQLSPGSDLSTEKPGPDSDQTSLKEPPVETVHVNVRDGAEATKDGSEEEAPDKKKTDPDSDQPPKQPSPDPELSPEELGPDSDLSPEIPAPKRERSLLKRVRRFFRRAVRRVFGSRSSSERAP